MQSEFELIFAWRHCFSNCSNILDHDAPFDLFAVNVVNCVIGNRKCSHLRHAPRIGLLDIVCVNESVCKQMRYELLVSIAIVSFQYSEILLTLAIALKILISLPFPISFFRSGSCANAM